MRKLLFAILFVLLILPTSALGWQGIAWDLYDQAIGNILASDNTWTGEQTFEDIVFEPPLILVPSATDPTTIDIQGDTNDYTGAATEVTFKLARDINRGTGNSVSLAAGWQSYLNQKHTDALLTGDREAYGAISRIDNQGAITNATASNYQYWSNGAHNTAKMSDTAVFDTDSTGILEIAVTGTYGYAFADAGWTITDTGGNTPANTVVASGVRSFVDNRLVLTAGAAATVINAGFYVETVLGNASGTSLGAGLYIPNGVITGSDTNYGIYDLSDLPWYVAGDVTIYDTLTVIPDGTNEVFQVNDGTIDFTDGNGGVAGVLTVSAGGDWSYNKDLTLSNGSLKAVDLYTENGTTSAGSVYFYEDSSNGTNTAQLIGPASTADVVLTLPASTGTILIDANNLSDVSNTATSYGNIKQAATTSATGAVELATDAEQATGTSDTVVSTPGTVASVYQYQVIYVDAGAFVALTTKPAASGTNEYGATTTELDYFAFDGGSTEERIQFKLAMPENWDRGIIKAKFFHSSATSSSTNDTVEWGIKGVAIGDDDAINVSFGTPQVITDTMLNDNGADMQVTSATPAITIGGTPALADIVAFEIYRNTDGTDSMAEDAWLFGAWIQYKIANTVAAW